VLKRGKSEQCPPQQLLCNTLWQKYCKNTVSFLFTILCTVLTTRIKYSTLILICVLVNPLCEWHPIFIAKSSHWTREQPFIRAGFAIPEGAPLSGFHYLFSLLIAFNFPANDLKRATSCFIWNCMCMTPDAKGCFGGFAHHRF